MTKKSCFILSALLTVLGIQAQVTVYEVTKNVSPYEEMTGANVIDLQGNTGTDLSKLLFDADGNANFNAADDVTAFPIGFDFSYNGYTMKYFLLTGDAVVLLYDTPKVTTDIVSSLNMASPVYTFAGDNSKNSFGCTSRQGAFGYDDTEISYKTEGEAGNRVLTIQYKNLGWQSTAWDVNDISKVQVQYRLYEATGNIEMKLNDWKPFDNAEIGNSNWIVAGITGDAASRNWLFLKDYEAADYGPDALWGYYKPQFISYDHENYPADGTTWTFVAPDFCKTPATAPSQLSLTSTTNAISGTFTKGDGDSHLVLVSQQATLKDFPIDKTKYKVGDKIGDATVAAISEDGTFATPDNLTASTTYYMFVYTFNELCSNGPLYNSTPVTASIKTMPTAPKRLIVNDVDKNDISVSVTANNNADAVLVAITEERGIHVYSSGATDYLESGAFGIPAGSYAIGDEIEGGGKVIFVGTATQKIAIGQLQTGTTYYLRAWSSDGAGGYSSVCADLAVVTASELPWKLTVNEQVGYNASLPGWMKDTNTEWNSDPDTRHELWCNMSVYGKKATAWIETPYIYMATKNTTLTTSLGGSQGIGWAMSNWILEEGDRISFQLTKDNISFTDIFTITKDEIETLSRSELTPVSTTFNQYAGQKVRLRIYVERSSVGEFHIGEIELKGEDEENVVNSLPAGTDSNAVCHNLQGIRLKQPQKGINIRNGKKIIVR